MLSGKVCFVSGAARRNGIGRAVALALAREGANVAIGDILDDQAKIIAAEITAEGVNSCAVYMDLQDYHTVTKGFSTIEETLGPVDILVNNAAVLTNVNSIEDMPINAWKKDIEVNLSGAFYCTKAVLPSMMKQKWGRIINISSITATMGGHGQCGYASSKAGLIGLTKTTALEGAPYGITSNIIIAGVIGTDTFNNLNPSIKERIPRASRFISTTT